MTTLESLENLHSLKSINAGHNRLKNLSVINLLVPLAGSIVNLDLSRNPMSADPRYAAYVVSAFPKLAMFDSRDLGTFLCSLSYGLSLYVIVIISPIEWFIRNTALIFFYHIL